MESEVVEHIKSMRPVLDKENLFLFFSNNKVAQTSINRHLLKGRAIVYKDNPKKHRNHFSK